MPALAPISRSDLIRRLRQLGFEGPFAGGRHQYMLRGDRTLVLPNPHQPDVGVGLLSRVLRQAGISRDEWLSLI